MTDTPPSRVPLLVVDGGPSGLAAAIELGRRGVEVLVVEPRTARDPLRPRAKTTSVRTMEHLRRWGLARRQRAACPLRVDYAQDVAFCTGLLGHEITRFPEAFGLTVGQQEENPEPGQQAPQSTVEEVLRAAAAELPSVTLLEGWGVTEVHDGAAETRATLLAPDGTEHQVAADYLLGCDGSGGIARAAIDGRCGRRRRGAGHRSVVGADAVGRPLPRDANLPGRRRGQLNPPSGGHGFNTCVGDAVNIGWKLAAVLEGWAPESLLDSYEAEHRPVARWMIAAAGNQEAFLAQSFAAPDLEDGGPAGRARRESLVPAPRVKDSEFHSLGLVLGYDYADSPVVVPDDRPAPEQGLTAYHPSGHPGARLPHTWLPNDGSIYDLLGDGFALLRLSPDADSGPLADAATRRRLPIRVLDLAFAPGTAGALRRRAGAGTPRPARAWRGAAAADPDAGLARVVGEENRALSPAR